MTPDQNSLLQLASSAEKRNNEYESKRKMVDSDGTEIQGSFFFFFFLNLF